MNIIFIVTHYNFVKEEDKEIIGSFNTRIIAILFVKYLMKEGIEGYFDIEMVEPLSIKENIDRYMDSKSVTVLVASTLHAAIVKHGQIYLFKEKRIIDLFKDDIKEKEEDN